MLIQTELISTNLLIRENSDWPPEVEWFTLPFPTGSPSCLSCSARLTCCMARCRRKRVLPPQLHTIFCSLDLLEYKILSKILIWTDKKKSMLTCEFSRPSWHLCIWSLFSFIHSWTHRQPLSLLYLITRSVPFILSYIHNFQALSVRRSFSCSCRLKWRWKVTRLTFDHFPWVMFCSELILRPLTCSAVHSAEAPVTSVPFCCINWVCLS